jgi:hypothetical protein
VAAILATSIKARKATIISLGVPILISAYLFLIMPLYIRSQLLLSEQSLLTENLIISVDGFRDRVNFRDGPVFIRYTPAIINGNWFHTRILPFLMSADQRLSSNKIFIINEWNDHDDHLPVRLLKMPEHQNYKVCFWRMTSDINPEITCKD